MPTYQYRCTACHQELEAVQKFTDEPLTECPQCNGSLRKVFNAVGVVFKGSGFYATDNRSKGKVNAAKATDPKPATSASEGSPSSESKPAAPGTSSTGASTAA